MWALLGKLLGGVIGGAGRILPDRDRQNEAQSRINEAEVSGAPSSRLRLWRSFLGWVLSVAFLWELLRPVILHYIPDADLPPSMIKEITTLLLGMLGLGF